MTVRAALMRYGPPEIAAGMATGAGDLCMLSCESEPRVAVIEIPARVIVLPAGCVVASLAGATKLGLLKGPAMGIGMTALAAAGLQAFEKHRLFSGLRLMALLASDRLM